VSPDQPQSSADCSHSTLGRPKVEVARERILDINPAAEVEIHPVFVLPENAADILSSDWDYVVDAIDTVSAKIELAVAAQQAGVRMISCNGRRQPNWIRPGSR
jgi:tRNA A37 threonylcarbamoyladenosine dehydratase